MEYLRRLGYVVDICERFIGPVGIRKDLFGCFDLIAFDSRLTIGVQSATTKVTEHLDTLHEWDLFQQWNAGIGRTVWMLCWRKKLLKPHHKMKRYIPRLFVPELVRGEYQMTEIEELPEAKWHVRNPTLRSR